MWSKNASTVKPYSWTGSGSGASTADGSNDVAAGLVSGSFIVSLGRKGMTLWFRGRSPMRTPMTASPAMRLG
ncbi:hypothetical protein DMH04_25590 [Kibdelosporangium aridum]|uniref:Uncharacterized protein n=1 Tax=Kibdelosporangium aridum TaxID=2030 RepID=A0A428Z6A5_KIBAR|nr:hypothetical protein DMH04_25590 [Kibdelosporangium aridum]